jgi:hypothetical protein
MDPREIETVRRRHRREHARWHRQEARRWRTPRELRRALAAWRDRREIAFYADVRPGMLAIPPDDPIHADMFRRMGRQPQYVPVRRTNRLLFAVLRALRLPAPKLVRVPGPSSGGDDGTTGVREPRRPRPTAPSAGAAPLPAEDDA